MARLMGSGASVLVFGGTGLLGAPLALKLADQGHDVCVASRSKRFPESSPIKSLRCDVGVQGVADRVLQDVGPAWVINCAAITNLDACEANPVAERVNMTWPRELAAAAASAGARCVHISTDAVFSTEPGAPEPREDDQRRPLSAYARQKAGAEDGVLEASNGEALVARTNFFGWSPALERGLAAWALRELRAGREIQGFADVFFNPLYAGDAVDLLVELINAEVRGLIHLVGAQCLSKLAFLRDLAEAFGLDADLIKEGSVAQAGLKAPRSLNLCLSTERLHERLGRPPPMPREGLRRMFGEEASLCAKLATLEEYPE